MIIECGRATEKKSHILLYSTIVTGVEHWTERRCAALRAHGPAEPPLRPVGATPARHRLPVAHWSARRRRSGGEAERKNKREEKTTLTHTRRAFSLSSAPTPDNPLDTRPPIINRLKHAHAHYFRKSPLPPPPLRPCCYYSAFLYTQTHTRQYLFFFLFSNFFRIFKEQKIAAASL